MKNIVLSMVVIGALVAAALGGTLAGFSDTEEITDNRIQVGSIDLKVASSLAGPWKDDPGLKTLLDDEVQPCNSTDFTFYVKNVGQPAGHKCDVYMKVKNLECFNVKVTHTGEARPEPEIVAEDGGWLAQKYIPGIGQQGDNCNLADFIECTIYYNWDGTTGKVVYTGTFQGAADKFVLLGPLDKCADPEGVNIRLHFKNISEDDLGRLLNQGDPWFKGVDNDGDTLTDEDGWNDGVDGKPGVDDDGDTLVDEDPGLETGHFDKNDADVITFAWDHWPTNAFMKDKVTFNVMLALDDLGD